MLLVWRENFRLWRARSSISVSHIT